MNIVRENISFKRGQEPAKSLEIGKYRKIYAPYNLDNIPDGFYLGVGYEESSKEYPELIRIITRNLKHFDDNKPPVYKPTKLASEWWIRDKHLERLNGLEAENINVYYIKRKNLKEIYDIRPFDYIEEISDIDDLGTGKYKKLINYII